MFRNLQALKECVTLLIPFLEAYIMFVHVLLYYNIIICTVKPKVTT